MDGEGLRQHVVSVRVEITEHDLPVEGPCRLGRGDSDGDSVVTRGKRWHVRTTYQGCEGVKLSLWQIIAGAGGQVCGKGVRSSESVAETARVAVHPDTHHPYLLHGFVGPNLACLVAHGDKDRNGMDFGLGGVPAVEYPPSPHDDLVSG